MEQNFETIKEQLQNLEAEVKARITDEVNDRHPIYDGPIALEDYLKSNIKILWLLKEAYDEVDGEGGDWGYNEMSDKMINELVFGKPYRTWQPVIITSYNILNNENKVTIDHIKENNEIFSTAKKIAVVNLQKLPAINRTDAIDERPIINAVQEYGDIILLLIKILNPTIIICGGTFKFMKNKFQEIHNVQNGEKFGSLGFTKFGNSLLIDAYHPSQRNTVDKNEYIKDIVDVVRKHLKENC